MKLGCFRHLFLTALGLLLGAVLGAQNSYQLYVYESKTLASPNPPISNAAINQTAWASRHNSVSVVKTGTYSAKVTVNSYFTDVAEIQCDYYYYYYVNNKMYTGNATTYYTIRCKSVDLTLSETSLTLEEGDSQHLTYNYSPSNVSHKPTLTWGSTNDNVATVYSNGNVVAQREGQCRIVLYNDMGPNAECQVTVKKKNIPATGITISPSSISLFAGVTKQLSYSLEPNGATASVTWSSEFPEIASVSQNGAVTGESIGETHIYARTNNGIETSIIAKVLPSVESIKLSPISAYEGFSYTLIPEIIPEDIETELSWSCSDPNVAFIDQNGVLLAKKEGTVTITVITDNGKKATANVTIKPAKGALNARNLKNKIAILKTVVKNIFDE